MIEEYIETEEQKEKIHYKTTFNLLFNMAVPLKRGFFTAFFYLLASTALSLLGPIIAKYTFDTAIPSKKYSILAGAVALYLFNSVFLLVFNYLMRMKLVKTAQEIIMKLKNRLLEHLLTLDMDFYSKNPVGRLTARVQSDTSSLYELFTETSITIFKDILMFFATFAIMAFFNLKLTLILSTVFPFIFLFTFYFVRKSSPMFVAVRKLLSEISAFLTEHLNAISIVQTFNREAFVMEKLDKLNERKFTAELSAELTAIIFFLTILLLHPVSLSIILGIGGLWALENKITIGTLIMFILYIDELFGPVFRFGEHMSIIQKAFSAGHRVSRILSLKPSVIDIPNPHYFSSIKTAVEFKGVWMKYTEESDWALKNVSFSVPKGVSLAIVGETGGGKTTVTNLLFKFYVPQKGSISIDGIDISRISAYSVRRSIGLVQQDIYLFPGTIMDNLKLMDSVIPDSKVHDAIKSLGTENFFKTHGLNKHVIEKGANLSTGEKQIISLVRSMVLDQEMLVLDEATSNVDPYTERIITRAMKEIMRQKTMIVVAHRLSTIKNADRIVFLSKGEIKEGGSHAELMNKKGWYWKFYRLQFGEN